MLIIIYRDKTSLRGKTTFIEPIIDDELPDGQ
jgi:hypothetical protein